MEANYIQKRMEELQKSDDFANAFGRLLSGKSGYKAVIEKKQVQIKCPSCGIIFDSPVKFCSECGMKIEWPKKE
ncbi:MAG: hypothetical protein ABIE36_01460 [Candidatus Diapherotrites archaeon]